MSNIWQQLNADLSLTVDNTRNSLVQITSTEGGIGAGTIWHEDGLIITNAHVILERDEILRKNLAVVTQDDKVYPAQVVGYDSSADLAALAIEAKNLPTVIVGSSANLQAGQWVTAMGHPWGVVDALTSGIIIGTGANLPERNDGREWIALSLKLRPGHSGGPLLNVAGEVIGINTMISGPAVGFAIPVDVVKGFLKETINGFEAKKSQTPLSNIEPTFI